MIRGERAIRDVRVLVVDSDPDALELLAVALIESGFSVRTATNADEALLEARRRTPSVVLAADQASTRGGLALCGALRRDLGREDIPFVLLTDRGGAAGSRGGTLRPAGVRVFPKPVDLPGLIGALRGLVA
ncbi:MAG: response regulator [Chloroflexota bacterium]